MRNALRHQGRLVALALASLVGGPTEVLPQSGQRSTLAGTVTDASGGAIAGASVVLTGPLISGPRTVTTSTLGRYRFTNLLPGAYVVVVSAAGFGRAERAGVEVPIEATVTLDVALGLERVAESVTVEAALPQIDVTSSAAPERINQIYLRNLPSRRSLQALLNLAPGVTDGVAFGGSQATSNAASLDGVRLGQPSTGEAWVPTGYNWLESAQVVALGAPAEYSQFTGAVVDGVLRSGSNQVRGIAEYVAALPDWTGDNTGGISEELQEIFVPMNLLSWWDANAQLGGPLRRDRLWLFGGAMVERQRHRAFGYAGPHATSAYGPRGILKTDAALSRDWTAQAFYQFGLRHIDGAEFGPGVQSPEVSADVRARDHVFNARSHRSGNGASALEVRVGGNVTRSRNDPHPPATREGPPQRIDLTAGTASGNTWLWSDARRSSVSMAGTLTHALERGPGSHWVRGGLEFERRSSSSAAGYPGGMNIYEESGVPVFAEIWAGGIDRPTGHRFAGFVQDRWTLGRVTVEPGLRVDWNRGSVPEPGTVLTTTPLAPRLGIAWAASGDGRSVVRGHYGRYHDALFGYFFQGLDTTNDNPRLLAVPGPGGWEEIDRSREGASSIDPDIKQSHVDQWVVGGERQVLDHLAVEARVVIRRFGNFMGFIDPRFDDWSPVVVPDPGPDGVGGTGDDAGTLTGYVPYPGERELVVGNPAGIDRTYRAIQFIARKRYAQRWQGEVSYNWTRSSGFNNQANSNTGFWGMSPGGIGADPNYTPQGNDKDRPVFDHSEVKALGTWQAPWFGGFSVSGIYRWQTGVRWQRKVFVANPLFRFLDAEPIGTRQNEAYGIANLRLEKLLPVGRSTLGIYLDIFNVTNTGVATLTVQRSGPMFGTPGEWTEPRIFRLAGRLTF